MHVLDHSDTRPKTHPQKIAICGGSLRHADLFKVQLRKRSATELSRYLGEARGLLGLGEESARILDPLDPLDPTKQPKRSSLPRYKEFEEATPKS